MVFLHIGFDDTDSSRCGCTTYIAALLVERLTKIGVTFCDYPNLIRLNPNVPWKTRGNGALCLRIKCDESLLYEIKDLVINTVKENSDLGFKDTDPGIVLLFGTNIPEEVQTFSKKTIQSLVKKEDALRLINSKKAESIEFGTGYGIVGALAAIGETLLDDYTYELITYRTRKNRGSCRKLGEESIRNMDNRMSLQTFNNIDPEKNRILITPRGPDPVFFGVRGESAEAVLEAFKMIHPLEVIERWAIFRTNQGTDAHLRRVNNICGIKEYNSVVAKGTVLSEPIVVPRRHRIFSIGDKTGKIQCAAYEPTGALRRVAAHLKKGDSVVVSGGVKLPSNKNPLTINLEKVRILELAPDVKTENPLCPNCGKRMKSMGVKQGFRCKRCSFKLEGATKNFVIRNRLISKGLFITSPRSQRHLTKPLCRYGKEKFGKPVKMIAYWHDP